jgi:PBP1b-binding outer membrane lipoprotein LpoB
MKKYIATILLSVLLFSGCIAKESNDATPSSLSTTTETPTQISAEKNLTLTEKHLKEIDEEYKHRLENDELSNFEVGELSREYAEKWRIVADEYYNKILKKSDEFSHDQDPELLKSSMQSMKGNWNSYSEQEKEDYHNLLRTIHGGGTIVGPDTAKYEYEMEKQWALKILGIAERLGID